MHVTAFSSVPSSTPTSPLLNNLDCFDFSASSKNTFGTTTAMRTQLHIHTHMFINICTYGLATCTDFLGNAVVRVVDGAATAAASVWLCVCVCMCVFGTCKIPARRVINSNSKFAIITILNSPFAFTDSQGKCQTHLTNLKIVALNYDLVYASSFCLAYFLWFYYLMRQMKLPRRKC